MINATELLKMDYAFQGQPFVCVPASSSIDLKTMDYAYLAQPFFSNYYIYYYIYTAMSNFFLFFN
jgi:hypothetical protein